mmetsp:Transcript_1544/g.2117  ORF Transcript_1544/g.2117 Transcript_1544/m.2117 type:complete len:208 (-) Transcript_1544:446-1069(-)
MHPWISLDEITQERLEETVNLAKEYLGVKTIIFITIPKSNNIRNMEEWYHAQQINTMVKDFAHSYTADNTTKIMISDFSSFLWELVEANARESLGYDTSDDSFLFRALPLGIDNHTKKHNLSHSIATICSVYEAPNSTCTRFAPFLLDGLHICLDTLSPRISANLACLMACSYASRPNEGLRQCEQRCYDSFFSLKHGTPIRVGHQI